MDRTTGLTDEVPHDRLGQAPAGLAVAARLGADGGEPLIVAELLESIDGIVAGVVVGEDLGEEDAQGDPGGVDSLPPEMAAVTARGLDEWPREEVEEGEPLLLTELLAQGIESVAGGGGGTRGHGDLLGLDTYGVRLSITMLPTQKVAFLPPEVVAHLNF